MQSQLSARFPLFLAVIGGLFLLMAAVAMLIPRVEVEGSVPSTPAAVAVVTAGPGLPSRLLIPEIGVDAFIESIGLTSQGSLDAPKGPANAAWFYLGPRPGEKGDAIIDGHSGWRDGIPAAFDDLDKLEPGDLIFVEDESGEVVTFAVRESRMYDEDEVALAVFRSYDDLAHLNLITCEGLWNKETKSYSQRLVVLTDRIYE